MNKIRFFGVLAVSVMALMGANTASAQPPQHGGFDQRRPEGRPEFKKESVEVRAKRKTDMMNAEVKLDEKQYSKIYKLFKREYRYTDELMTPKNFGPGAPDGGRPMGGPGGGMGPGGPRGGMGPGGPGGMGPGGPRPGGPGAIPMDEDTQRDLDRYMERQDKKIRKILSDEQYRIWSSKHPVVFSF